MAVRMPTIATAIISSTKLKPEAAAGRRRSLENRLGKTGSWVLAMVRTTQDAFRVPPLASHRLGAGMDCWHGER